LAVTCSVRCWSVCPEEETRSCCAGWRATSAWRRRRWRLFVRVTWCMWHPMRSVRARNGTGRLALIACAAREQWSLQLRWSCTNFCAPREQTSLRGCWRICDSTRFGRDFQQRRTSRLRICQVTPSPSLGPLWSSRNLLQTSAAWAWRPFGASRCPQPCVGGGRSVRGRLRAAHRSRRRGLHSRNL